MYKLKYKINNYGGIYMNRETIELREKLINSLLWNDNEAILSRLEKEAFENDIFEPDNGEIIARRPNESLGQYIDKFTVKLMKNFSKEKTKAENNQNENINSTENITEEQTEEKIYSNNVISLNIGKLSDSWKVVEKQNGSIIFYIQGPIKQNEDGTTDDIRINVYLEKSSMTNDELKTQMLEHSVYSNIEYTKIQLIDDVQWRQFDAENKEQKAKILAIMKDGYMYAIEITGEKSLYEQYYNEAMRTVMTIKFAERIPEDLAQKTIYNYDKYVNLKAGGTKYLLSSLNLSKTVEEPEEQLPEEYSEYTFTGIKYSDFEDAMTKYMTTDVLKNEFSEFINYNGGKGYLLYENKSNTKKNNRKKHKR